MYFDLLILNCRTLSLDHPLPSLDLFSYVGIVKDTIIAVGSMSSLGQNWQSNRVIDAKGSLIMPGLVNGHNHCAMTLFRGLADDLPLTAWLHEHIFPAEARFVSPDMVYWCTRLAAAEMILSGTTAVADGYFYETEAARGLSDSGIRAVTAQGVIDFPAPGIPDPKDNIDAAATFIDTWQGHDLITPAIFCHSPYTCSARTIKKAKELARETGTTLFIHVAETEAEVVQSRKSLSLSPVRFLYELGVLDQNTVCIHCVWLDDDDIMIIQKTGASIVTCPESNMKLGSGIAPVKKFIDSGIRVGLGTDGSASNNNLDLFSEMDTMAKIHKGINCDPTLLPAAQVIRMATREGADIIGLKKTGELAAGMKADLIIIDLNKPHLTPQYDLASLLVYTASGSDVATSIINGRVIMENQVFQNSDLEEIMAKVKEMAIQVRAAI